MKTLRDIWKCRTGYKQLDVNLHMKILSLFIIFLVILYPVYVYAETSLVPIDDSKYIASAQIELRDSDGNLVGVTTSNAGRYLPDPIVDEFLELYPVKENIMINEKKYELREIVVTEVHQKDSYVFISHLFVQTENGSTVEIFRGLNHAFLVKSGDESTIMWTILKVAD